MTNLNSISAIRRELLAMIAARRGRPRYPTYDFIYEYGQEFELAPLPSTMKRGRPKECYANAEFIASRHADYAYAEGYALHNNMLFDHAWCVKDGVAIDPTLSDLEHVSIIGVVISRSLHLAEMEKSKTLSVLEPAGPNEPFFRLWASTHSKTENLPISTYQ